MKKEDMKQTIVKSVITNVVLPPDIKVDISEIILGYDLTAQELEDIDSALKDLTMTLKNYASLRNRIMDRLSAQTSQGPVYNNEFVVNKSQLNTGEHSRLIFLFDALRAAPEKSIPILRAALKNIEDCSQEYCRIIEALSKTAFLTNRIDQLRKSLA